MGELFKRLRPREPAALRITKGCLILDTSYSMAGDDGNGRRIDLLREAVREIRPTPQIFYFGRGAGPVESPDTIPEPHGSTPMDAGFDLAKQRGYQGGVLITDGCPDSDEAALQSAKGMVLDIIYVGPEPMPPFLDRLARQCNGTLAIGHLAEPKVLGQQIAGLLSGPSKDVVEL